MAYVVGLAGRIAAGKGETASYLNKKHAAVVHRFSDILTDVLSILNIPVTRANLQSLGSGLRKIYGDGVLVEAMKKRVTAETAGIVVIDGIRYPNEYDLTRSFDKNVVVFVDSPINLRYERCVRRGTRGEAGLTFEEFKESDGRETEKSLIRLRESADELIINDGSIEDLHAKIDSVIKKHSF